MPDATKFDLEVEYAKFKTKLAVFEDAVAIKHKINSKDGDVAAINAEIKHCDGQIDITTTEMGIMKEEIASLTQDLVVRSAAFKEKSKERHYDFSLVSQDVMSGETRHDFDLKMNLAKENLMLYEQQVNIREKNSQLEGLAINIEGCRKSCRPRGSICSSRRKRERRLSLT